ncbi:MAG: sodium:calcium antiporter [Chloroflexota bacterium]
MEQPLLLVVAFVVILLGAELFTNGIEWVGHHLDLAEGAVGSVLAAVGTALPETMIPLVAILLGGNAADASDTADGIGVGAILGAPFMLATLAMFVTGVAVLLRARRRGGDDTMPVDTRVIGKDVTWFLGAYALAVGTAFLPPGSEVIRLGVAVLLLVIYAIYVRAHFAAERAESESEHELQPLRMHRLDRPGRRVDPTRPRLRIVWVQVIVALTLIIGGAVVFVDAVDSIASGLGVAPVILALVIAPIATELPEKLNSVIWIRAGKDTLAMGNITGAMVFQSCIPTVIGLVFAADAWHIDPSDPESLLAFLSAGIAFLATAAIFLPMWRRARLRGRGLLMGGAFYLGYLMVVVALAGSTA